jgi:hypothetical protein
LYLEDTIYEQDVLDPYRPLREPPEQPVIHPEPTVAPQPMMAQRPVEAPRPQGGIGAVPPPPNKSADADALLVLLSEL